MTDVQETKLPGVGVRHDFVTSGGRRIGVINHHAGHRELLIYDDRDPDVCRETLRIDEHEAHTLAEMLGAAQVQERATAVEQSIEGMLIDWLAIDAGSPVAGQTIGALGLRQRTGASIIAVIREHETIPSPGPEEQIDEGDTIVVVGDADDIARTSTLLHDA